MMLRKFVLLSLCIATASNAAFAGDSDDEDDDDGDEYKYGLGAFVMAQASIFAGGQDEVEVYPWFQAEWGRFFVNGPALGVLVQETDNWGVLASLELDFTGDTDRGDSPELSDMNELNEAVLASIQVYYETDLGEIDFTIGSDIGVGHKGYIASFSYGYPMEFRGWEIEPSIEIGWSSKEINQYFYGISEIEVRANRPFYQANAGVIYEVGLLAMYSFDQRHSILVEVENTFYSSEIRNSPIVSASNAFVASGAYIYHF
jgi:outer membrane scaffolding protein for murein synthesis (MipA/OmpV family)